jgi:peptidoglycan/xylan/chitin deacetylase (PgdA/CDA1 family)
LVDASLAKSPVQWAAGHRSRACLRVLAYHGIDDPDTFEEHIAYLAARYRPVSVAEVEDAAHGGSGLPPGAVLITLDDGHPSVLETGAPILARHGVPALAFVLPGLMGTTRPFWWDEVRVAHELAAGSGRGGSATLVQQLKRIPDSERRQHLRELGSACAVPTARQLSAADLHDLRAMGVEIGNHTWDHPCLPRCTAEDVATQIEQAHILLSGWLGFAPTAFAFPNGDFDERARPVLRRLGYRLAFLFDHRMAKLPVPDSFAVSRLRVNSDTGIDRLKIILSGLHPRLHQLRGRS